MQAKLMCKTGQLAGAEFLFKNEATVGTKTDNSIELYPSIISGRHARIFWDAEASSYFLEDLKSRNGTKLDGMEVKEIERLDSLHIITFADHFEFIFQRFDSDAPPPPVKTTPQAMPPDLGETGSKEDVKNKTVFGGELLPIPDLETPEADKQKTILTETPLVTPDIPTGKNKIFVVHLKSQKNRITLTDGRHIVGRAAESAISIDDASISRQHAVILIKDGSAVVEDLGSKNHTYVDGHKIDSKVGIKPGTLIKFGEVEATIEQG